MNERRSFVVDDGPRIHSSHMNCDEATNIETTTTTTTTSKQQQQREIEATETRALRIVVITTTMRNCVLCILFLWTTASTTAFLVSHHDSNNRRQRHCHVALQQTTTKSVYESADPSKLIVLTDYLRNPRPVVVAKEDAPTGTLKEVDIANERLLLEQAIASSKNAGSAKKIVETLATMRNSDTDQQVIAGYLDSLLQTGPDQKLPFWSKWRFLSRYSRRARWATLRRTLNLTTPPPNVEDDAEDTAEDQQRRRRRALVSLLQTLANPSEDDDDQETTTSVPVIVSIEQKAKRDRNAKPTADMRNRLPADLETPQYQVVAERREYEIRRYDPFAVCSVSMSKARPADSYKTDATISNPKMGGTKAFGALAGYLFGKNEESTAMKMTTPVINRGQADADRTMSFVLPSEFWKDGGLDVAPKPLQDSGVMLERVEGQERAVVMFGGYASKKEADAKKQLLLEKLKSDTDWMAVEESADLMQYNDPFTAPWKRLNEVSVAVRPRT